MTESIILQTAYRLFTTQSIQLFTMDEIASRLAISKKTLYRFFTSRQHLVQQVCQLVVDDYCQALEAAEKDKTDNLQKVLGFMAANVAFCKKTSFIFFADLQKHYPAEYQYLTTTLNNITEQRLLRVLEQGIVEGVFRGSLHPKLVVTILLQHIKRDFEFAAELVNDYSKDEVFRQAMYMFLYGIIAPEATSRLEYELKQYSLPNRMAHTEKHESL
jgi:AcrR family transcriptional regulator